MEAISLDPAFGDSSEHHNEHEELHRELIELLNRLQDAINEENPNDTGTIFMTLTERINSHLDDEELLLLHHGYPNIVAARRKHEKHFRQMLCELQRQFQADNVLSPSVPVFLRDWFIGHVEDERYLFICVAGEKSPSLIPQHNAGRISAVSG